VTWAPRLPLSPSPAINPATGRGRCVASVGGARPAGLPFLDGDGAGRRACGRAEPSRGFARCVVRWRARALQGFHCSCPLRNQERIWEGGQWAPPPTPLVPASPSAYLHRAIRVDAGMPDAWTCCRTRRVERRNRFLADRAVLPRREEWRRTTSATSPVLKSFFFRLLYITSRS